MTVSALVFKTGAARRIVPATLRGPVLDADAAPSNCTFLLGFDRPLALASGLSPCHHAFDWPRLRPTGQIISKQNLTWVRRKAGPSFFAWANDSDAGPVFRAAGPRQRA